MDTSVIQTLETEYPAGVRVTERADNLQGFQNLDCAAMIWHRRPLKSFQKWINGLKPDHLPRIRVILRPDAVSEAVAHICDATGTPDCIERSRLIEDISALSQIFADLMDAGYIRLRLDVITTNACRKFHVDAVTGRLVCTYRGTGTQYGTGSVGADPRRIFTVPAGMPILLRGTKWQETPPSGLLHRSPPIEGSGETRLVLVLDPVSDPEEAF